MWTGAVNNSWTEPGNWDPSVPGAGGEALFFTAGNGNTVLNLGGATQPIRSILVETADAASYTFGQSPGDAFSFDAFGELKVKTGVATPQTVNAKVVSNGLLEIQNSVPNGVTSGIGLIGLTLNDIHMAVGGNLIVENGVGSPAIVATTVLNGVISDHPSQPGFLWLRSSVPGTGSNTNFIINGENTYSGGTKIQVNTGSNGGIYIGSDSAFGTGKITNTIQNNSPEYRALNGTRTIANDIDLDGGINFNGADPANPATNHGFVFTGNFAVISGNSRTLSNKITGGATVTLGASPGSSVIYLGNPVANGGDDVGRTLIVAPQPGATIILNAVAQDAADPNIVGSGARGTLHFGGISAEGNPGTTLVNSRSTYTGPTLLGNGSASIVQFNQDYNAGDLAGPFGLGTFTTNNSGILQPVGGDRTLANPVHISANAVNSHLTVSNATGDTSGLILTGPITMSSGGRSIRNNFSATGGVLTLGSAASPSTFTLATTAGQTLTITGTGRTIINHTIQDSPGVATHMEINNSATTIINGAQNTDGNLTVRTNATVVMNGNRAGAGSITLTGTAPKLFVHGTKTGGGTVTIGGTSTLGGTGSLAGDVINNGRIAPGSLEGLPGTLTLTGNVTNNANSTWLIGLDGATAGKLAIGGNLDLSEVDSLDVVGTGTGSSWVIATYAGTLTGTFDNVTPGYTVDYGSGVNSQITLLTAGLPGDWNADGKVDAADYVVWRKDPAGHGGNPDGYEAWAQNFGNPPGTGSSLANVAAVPEPATLLLCVLGAAAVFVRVRR